MAFTTSGSGNRVGPILAAAEPTRGTRRLRSTFHQHTEHFSNDIYIVMDFIALYEMRSLHVGRILLILYR